MIDHTELPLAKNTHRQIRAWVIAVAGIVVLFFVGIVIYLWAYSSFDVPPQDSISVQGSVVQADSNGLEIIANGKNHQLEFTDSTRYDTREPFAKDSKIKAHVQPEQASSGAYTVIDIEHGSR